MAGLVWPSGVAKERHIVKQYLSLASLGTGGSIPSVASFSFFLTSSRLPLWTGQCAYSMTSFVERVSRLV
jgi:hypothetical protein